MLDSISSSLSFGGKDQVTIGFNSGRMTLGLVGVDTDRPAFAILVSGLELIIDPKILKIKAHRHFLIVGKNI